MNAVTEMYFCHGILINGERKGLLVARAYWINSESLGKVAVEFSKV
jgi:hypothetical protein